MRLILSQITLSACGVKRLPLIFKMILMAEIIDVMFCKFHSLVASFRVALFIHATKSIQRNRIGFCQHRRRSRRRSKKLMISFIFVSLKNCRRTQTIEPTPMLDIINCQRMHQQNHETEQQRSLFQPMTISPSQCSPTATTMMNETMTQPVSKSTNEPIGYHSIQTHRNR